MPRARSLRFHHFTALGAAAAATVLAPLSARALVFTDTGSTTYNTTAPGGALSNSGWQYEGDFVGYLATPIGPHNFVSAMHLNAGVGNALNLNGVSYASDSFTDFGDLRVYHTADTIPSYAPLYNTGDEIGKSIVDIGRGTPRGATVSVNGSEKGWLFGSHDGVQRWGENVISGIASQVTVGDNRVLSFTFDKNGGDQIDGNEAGLTDGDSGGGAFINVNGEWRLAGINYGVSGHYDYDNNGAPAGTPFLGSLYDTGGLWNVGDTSKTSDDRFVLDTPLDDEPYKSYLSRISQSYSGIYALLNLPPTWKTNGNGAWTTSGNWANGGVPDAVDAIADFRTIATAARTVTLNSAATVGRMDFDNLNRYTIGGSGSLFFDVSAGDAVISVASGSHTILLPITLNDPTRVDVISANSTLQLRGAIKFSDTNKLIKRGAGTLEVNNLRDGRLDINEGTVKVTGGSAGASILTNLALAGSTNAWQGRLDLISNDLIIRSSAANRSGQLAETTNQIKQGLNLAGVKWAGEGITSSLAGNGSGNFTAVGVILNDLAPIGGSGPLYTSFDGLGTGVNDILIKYTYFGDADLDGAVTTNDYFQIDNGFLGSKTGWINGDFDYDGAVTTNDYFLIDNALLGQGIALVPAAFGSASALSGVTAVPEPASLGVLAFAAAGLLRRRRR
jgi:hypothetical protein